MFELPGLTVIVGYVSGHFPEAHNFGSGPSFNRANVVELEFLLRFSNALMETWLHSRNEAS
jgi:hypothetical protein